MKFLLQENEIYELRSGIHLANRTMHTTHFGTDSISNSGSKIWKLIPDKIASTLSVLKSMVKSSNIDNCTCRLCKVFVKDLGFIEGCQNV